MQLSKRQQRERAELIREMVANKELTQEHADRLLRRGHGPQPLPETAWDELAAPPPDDKSKPRIRVVMKAEIGRPRHIVVIPQGRH